FQLVLLRALLRAWPASRPASGRSADLWSKQSVRVGDVPRSRSMIKVTLPVQSVVLDYYQNICTYMSVTGNTVIFPNTKSPKKPNTFTYTSSFIYVNVSETWKNAQSYCRVKHTDLASVRNQSENEQLKMMLNNSPTWIGLYRNAWMWSDGSAYSFPNWAPNKPLRVLQGTCLMEVKWVERHLAPGRPPSCMSNTKNFAYLCLAFAV
uniref:C-type lectin domain-containing protein n=1 Tax=Maylandia zebra TaxID=106582 RepID=A0A3P9ATL3_9CICH